MNDPHESLDPDLDHIAPRATHARAAAHTTSAAWTARRSRGRALVHRLVTLGLIVFGGATGTLLREVLSQAHPTVTGTFPWTTFGMNVSGSFLLGLLLNVVRQYGPDSGWRRRVRLTLGTGLLGGFTTYSTFALEVVSATPARAAATGPTYALGSIVAGLAAAALGLWLPEHLAGEQRR